MSQRRVLTFAVSPLVAGALICASTAPAVAAGSSSTTRSAVTAAQSTSGLTRTVGVTVNNVAQTATLNITKFVQQGSQILAVGSLALANGTSVPVQVPVNPAASAGTCPVLHLDLGPLDLNLLGLTIHLNEVVLDITAVPGAGNLLGNLLCAVAHLLDGPSPLGGLTALLNRILGALGGLGL